MPAVNGRALGELASLFLRLGVTAFGGPAAHIAMMRDEVVVRRQWITEEEFLDLIGATQLIPGPNSTELAIHIGRVRAGFLGLLVAGACFIFPAMIITGALAWAYVELGARPEANWILYGIKPVIIAVVVQALWGLAPKAARSWPLRVLGMGTAAAAFLGADQILVLFAAGAIAAAANAPRRQDTVHSMVPLLPLFLVFLKIGSVLFGSGYVLLAFLRTDLVERMHWMTEAQLIDAVAVGQVTPGPVFTTATFIGYLLAGPIGAVVATVGIFLPAFVLVLLTSPLLPKLRASKIAGGFLDGVNVASLALMAVVTVQLAHAAFVDVPTIAIGALAAIALLRFKVNSSWLVLGGAIAGAVVQSIAKQ
jgi:chromate transporter